DVDGRGTGDVDRLVGGQSDVRGDGVGPAGGARGTDAGRELEVVAGDGIAAVLEAEGGKQRRAGEIIDGGLLRRGGAEDQRGARHRRPPGAAPVARGPPGGAG